MPLTAFNLDKMQGQSIGLTPQPPLPTWERGVGGVRDIPPSAHLGEGG
jgi:hypothetical protein